MPPPYEQRFDDELAAQRQALEFTYTFGSGCPSPTLPHHHGRHIIGMDRMVAAAAAGRHGDRSDTY